MLSKSRFLAVIAVLTTAACGGGHTMPSTNPDVFLFHTITTIGSVVDPINGDQNPYGLAMVPTTAGSLTKGDLLICNFNDAANIQGNGTTVEAIHPAPGSTVARFAQSASLQGCGAIAAMPDGSFAVTAKLANDVPIYSPSGSLTTTLSTNSWHGPWGATATGAATPVLYVTNANDGSIVRVTGSGSGPFTFQTIATGFSVNNGVPGSILAPFGLSYSATGDTLYIMDSNVNRIVALANVSTIPVNGVTAMGNSFSGPSAANARVVASGPPLNNPLGSTILPNGNLGVVNDSDNLFMEYTPAGTLLGSIVLDPASGGGALFNIVATTNSRGQAVVYFVDDNQNTLNVLSP